AELGNVRARQERLVDPRGDRLRPARAADTGNGELLFHPARLVEGELRQRRALGEERDRALRIPLRPQLPAAIIKVARISKSPAIRDKPVAALKDGEARGEDWPRVRRGPDELSLRPGAV